MTVRTMQDCNRCGRTRTLPSPDRAKDGGWRELNSGSRKATLCNECIIWVLDEVDLHWETQRLVEGAKRVTSE